MATKDSQVATNTAADKTNDNAPRKGTNFASFMDNSEKFKMARGELAVTVKLSLTGITNLVVGHEDPSLVDAFLKTCFKNQELYNNTTDIDAIELQAGAAGKGRAAAWLDELIYGSFEMQKDPQTDLPMPVIDQQTGKRKRMPNGFVNRKQVISQNFSDKLLIIKNIDYCLDFCKIDSAGEVDARALQLFDLFRNPTVKKGCRILLVSNKPLKFPFKVRVVNFPKVDELEAQHVIDSFSQLYLKNKYEVAFSKNQLVQMVRKLQGLTYTEAGDAIAYAMSASVVKGTQKIDTMKVMKLLRDKINEGFMADGNGLTHLTSRPWEDYICPESSNFTWDVKKMLRDFTEIEKLKKEIESLVASKRDETETSQLIESIQSRIPHVILLYGKGGVGKSAFPVHLAGLLGFDVWDFNINATHSKWIGEGSRQMRETLAKISRASHLIVRIDEYDRGMGATGEAGNGMHEAHKQVESEFMNWLQNSQEEGLFNKQNIILVLTTNHKENITGPLLRSGRSDLVIDIDNFDSKSMLETFKTCARRMKNRGVMAIGYPEWEKLQEDVDKLDLPRLAELSTMKGFTVRDVEMLILEMASHKYYLKKYKQGLPWDSETFAKVLERSTGSTRQEGTGELILGDRALLMELTDAPKTNGEDKQMYFDFYKNSMYDPEKFKAVDFFKEK